MAPVERSGKLSLLATASSDPGLEEPTVERDCAVERASENSELTARPAKHLELHYVRELGSLVELHTSRRDVHPRVPVEEYPSTILVSMNGRSVPSEAVHIVTSQRTLYWYYCALSLSN